MQSHGEERGVSMQISKIVYTIKPPPTSQQSVWQLYSHMRNVINQAGLNLVDFKVPRTTYYGVTSYMNQMQMSLRTDTPAEFQNLEKFLAGPILAHPLFEIIRKK